MTDCRNIPILLLTFNRPDLTGRVLQRISEIAPARLFIAADGPRSNHPDDELQCGRTREVTRRIDWDCHVERLERSENLGCKRAVSSAITWFFEHVEEGIILEDDCLPDLTFFRFCAELLEKYRDDSRVALISGNNYQNEADDQASYYFSRYPHIWGWASWRRFWQGYDVDIKNWNGDRSSLVPYISHPGVRRHFASRFDNVKSGKKNTWDFQLVHRCFETRSLCINPSINLVENIGFDDRATHTSGTGDHVYNPSAGEMTFPLVHPSEMAVNEKADAYTEKYVQKVPLNRWTKWKSSFNKRWNRLTTLKRP